MITLTRLGHENEPFQLNVDMIVTVESTPDTVITLATGAKIVVAQSPAEVSNAVHEFRASVLAEAFRRRGGRGGGPSPAPPPGPPGGPGSSFPGVHREGAHLSAVATPPEPPPSGWRGDDGPA